ncbi:MAG: exo-alpha-sialidase [Verrucomicrobia bacterium]|nr:exo-alpha-sialidase [Verrucomicrobiota bacterium]
MSARQSSHSRPHVGRSLLAGAVSLAAALLAISALAAEIRIERVFGPEVPTGPYKHPASFDELQNGDLYLVFFSGQGEYQDDSAAVFGARLKQGARRWSKPVAIARNPFHSLGNAVVWQAPDGVVWLFYVTRYGDTWSKSRVTAKISRDGAHTWSEPFMLTFEAGTMVRGHPLALTNGDYLLPIYHEVGEDTESVSADCTSLFLRYEPAKRGWTETNRVRSRLGNIQPAPVQVSDEHLIAFCRRGGDYEGRADGWLVRTESHDGGRTWSEGKDSEFPNPNAAVDFIKLRNGHLLLVYNDSFAHRTPLAVALSTDSGKTFPHKRNLMEGPGDFGYPTAIQTRDGKIHVLFTSDERTVIRRATFAEASVLHPQKGNSSPDAQPQNKR